MIQHGSSHGLAVLVYIVLTALLPDLSKPHITIVLEQLTRFNNWLAHYIPVPFLLNNLT
jgi:hypothetical protein